MVESEFDRPNIVQPMMNGTDAMDMAFRRPYISLKIHPVNAPIGCTKNAQLAAITKWKCEPQIFVNLNFKFYRSMKPEKRLFEGFRLDLALDSSRLTMELQSKGIHRIGHCSVKLNYLPGQLMSEILSHWPLHPITSILNIRFAVHLTYLRQVATIFSNFFMFILRFFVVFVTVQYTWVCIVHFLSNKMNIFQK